jgi:hypothetical protein
MSLGTLQEAPCLFNAPVGRGHRLARLGFAPGRDLDPKSVHLGLQPVHLGLELVRASSLGTTVLECALHRPNVSELMPAPLLEGRRSVSGRTGQRGVNEGDLHRSPAGAASSGRA